MNLQKTRRGTITLFKKRLWMISGVLAILALLIAGFAYQSQKEASYER